MSKLRVSGRMYMLHGEHATTSSPQIQIPLEQADSQAPVLMPSPDGGVKMNTSLQQRRSHDWNSTRSEMRSKRLTYRIWLPRTLMLSSCCAGWPLRISFTFFKCVFIAISTPVSKRQPALFSTQIHFIAPRLSKERRQDPTRKRCYRFRGRYLNF